MKRRDCMVNAVSVVLGLVLAGCSTGLENGEYKNRQRQPARGSGSGASSGRSSRRGRSGPADLKELSKILQSARCPLTEGQIDFLLKIEAGPEFSEKMIEVLDDKQIEAVKNTSGGRRGRR